MGDTSCEPILNETEQPAKKRKPGIVYLSTLPPFMNVSKVKDIFSSYGEIERVFLQPADLGKHKHKKKPSVHFTEGWVEFQKKKTAKEVADTLNNTQIGGKKKSKFYDFIWNIKYLPRFKWAHLSERLAYERAVHKQKLRTEIAQAKREANFFSSNLEKNKSLKRKKSKEDKESENSFVNEYSVRETEMEIVAKKKKKSEADDRMEFLKTIYS